MSLLDKSFLLSRANPLLTGNVKIVISDEDLFLESFNSNLTLKKERFKHFSLKEDEYYKEAVQVFFNGLETNSIFQVKNINDKTQTYSDYKFQFDDIYFSGASFVEDNYYSQENEYLAPLYLKNKFPENFIIFRIDGSGSLIENSENSNFRSNFINKLKVVKLFDLSNNTTYGKWLDMNFIQDSIPKYPLEVKHTDVDLSLISGIDVNLSGWVTKTVSLFEMQSKNTPIFKSEEFISTLWRDNNLLYPHILNLKFLFDDTPATPTNLKKYSINRYSGFYINKKDEVKKVSSYKGFELNYTPFDLLETLNYNETLQIPYIKDNTFVRERDGMLYSFDPIKNGWDDSKIYWIEYNGEYFRLNREINEDNGLYIPNTIIGSYLFKIVAQNALKRDYTNDVDNTGLNSDDFIKLKERILINELGINYSDNNIEIGTTYKNRIVINNNIVSSDNNTFLRFKRTYRIIEDKPYFTIEIQTIDNTFKIDNFEQADIYLIKILDKYHVLKNDYSINTDYNINSDGKLIYMYINNGNISKDERYYWEKNIEVINKDDIVPVFSIYRLDFSDVKDFDFERSQTDYTSYDYEKEYEVKDNIQPKLYAKNYTEKIINIHTIDSNIAEREAILDANDRPLFIKKNDINLSTGLEYTDDDLYYKELDGTWKLKETWDENKAKLNREFYREEDYIFRLEDDNENLLGMIDFKNNSDSDNIYEGLTWGTDGKNNISDLKQPLPSLNSKNPNNEVDINYVPVSSEYVASDELWELRNNNLTPIWDKNQTICKWGFLNSIGKMNYPYRLNYSLDLNDYNNEPSRNSVTTYPTWSDQDLHYFYRFGLTNPDTYLNYSLHINNSEFDIDKYFSADFDYFEFLFNSDRVTSKGLLCSKLYSLFNMKDEYSSPTTLFKGIQYELKDVQQILMDNTSISDILTSVNTKYEDYKFAIIFSRKLSKFNNNPGVGNSNMGIDIYLNDKWKNVLINLFIDTDELVYITNPKTGLLVNAETCEIDYWYEDNISNSDQDINRWNNYAFKINNFNIGLRPRDFRLWDVMEILDNRNYNPIGLNKEKINFIHIYDDSSYKIMDYSNTDFILSTNQPKEIVINEQAYKTNSINVGIEVNNSLKYRKIVDNDPNNPFGDENFNTDGLMVDSVNDINCYNDYPIAKEIIEDDTRKSWELSTDDPSLFRYDGVYTPIFKDINLFRPFGYNEIRNSSPILNPGNYKFYDINSSIIKPIMLSFGMMEELIFSKCNNISSILKTQDAKYPMVDEYGYDFDARYLFTSSWEFDFYYNSKRIEVPENKITGFAGYTVHMDGDKEFFRIPDELKFNQEVYLVDNVNYNNYIDNFPTGERCYFNIPLIGMKYESGSNIRKFRLDILANKNYRITITRTNFIGNKIDMKVNAIVFNNDLSTSLTMIGPLMYIGLNNTYTNTFNTYQYNQYVYANSINLPSEYFTNDTLVTEFSFIFNSTSSTDINDYVIKFELLNETNNTLRVNSGNFYKDNDTSPLFNGFLKFNSTSGEVYNYPIISQKSTASIYTYSQMDDYDTSTNNVWREFAGFEATSARAGRVGIDAYAYDIYPLPQNWDGEVYITIMNNLKTGSGTKLSHDIKINNHYGYNTYTNTADQVKKFNLSTMYHFLEYGSQEPLSTPFPDRIDYINARFGYSNILNEFYKITGFQRTDIGFIDNFYSPYKIYNTSQFTFEPDLYSNIPDGEKCIYTGLAEGSLTKSRVSFKWYKTYRDHKLSFNIVQGNGKTIQIDVPLFNNAKTIKLTLSQIRDSINAILNNTGYTCLSSDNSTYATFTIESVIVGSYYNFTLNIITTKDFRLDTVYNSQTISYTSDMLTKTSLRENRNTGRINAFTIEFWIFAENWVKDNETIIYKGEDTDFNIWNDGFYNMSYAIGRDNNSDKLAFKTVHEKYLGGYSSNILVSRLEINDGQWHHIAVSFDVVNRTKSIYIDGKIDVEIVDFINVPIPDEQERVALFVENRNRFIPGDVHPSIKHEQTLANKIRLNTHDASKVYWYNVIVGLEQATLEDLDWQKKNWSTTIDIAYDNYHTNYESLDYYIPTDKDLLDWDIIIGGAAVKTNGSNNFAGFIDELRIWNYKRSENEIFNNYRLILKRDAYLNPLKTLIAYYRFDEGQGVNVITDLMNNYLIKNSIKWSKSRIKIINDGRKETEISEIKYFEFPTEYYKDSHIEIDDTETDWDVSKADIVGVSDERNISVPNPIQSIPLKDKTPGNVKNTPNTLIKRRKRRFVFNIKKKILDFTNSNDFRPLKWWLFKDVNSRKDEYKNTNLIKEAVDRSNKSWLNKVSKLIRKRR